MNKRRIAVEGGLSTVESALRARGFEVTKFTRGTMARVDGAVVTGMSENIMGIADTNGNSFPIVTANGMSADEVVNSLEARFAQLHNDRA